MNIELSENEKLLVVAPHPDDESIGCGGLLNKYRGQCDVLLVTTGLLDKPENKELIDIRQKEFEAAVKLCAVDNVFNLHIPAQKIKKNFNAFLSVDYSRYKYIFVPNRYEYHLDHVNTYYSIKKALRKNKAKSLLVEYEIWTALRFPNLYLGITEVKDLKIEAIRQHKTQLEKLDLVRFSIGLNTYRGLSKGIELAEAYYCETEKRRESFRRKKREIKEKIKRN